MRLATWNVNSVRTRLDRVLDFLAREQVDVLAMQETKVSDEAFPRDPFIDAGYRVVSHGFDQWNGVAVVSRVGAVDVVRGFPGQPAWGDPPVVEARALGVTCGGVRVWSLYVPNGRALDDPHYAYKLAWLAALRTAAAGWLADESDARVALVGDWNVAPLDTDVWDPGFFAGRTHVSAAERAALAAFDEAGYTETTRVHVPAEHTYTFWDYQQLRFARDEGMRIDLAYTSPALTRQVTGVRIVREERKGAGPSDHVPVVLDIGS
ncbi:MAG: exodeoxyribonuclease III [Cellulomonas sp.]|jgi:exodeoxyribonuclease-3|nr:exodeoxyribonuclease III [Cellulomonas sp.]